MALEKYQIEVVTANVHYAGTDAEIYVQFLAADRSPATGWLRLDDPHFDDFEAGSIDRFVFRHEAFAPRFCSVAFAADLGPNPQWLLDRINLAVWKDAWVPCGTFLFNQWFNGIVRHGELDPQQPFEFSHDHLGGEETSRLTASGMRPNHGGAPVTVEVAAEPDAE
jgi:hypothetical protein